MRVMRREAGGGFRRLQGGRCGLGLGSNAGGEGPLGHLLWISNPHLTVGGDFELNGQVLPGQEPRLANRVQEQINAQRGDEVADETAHQNGEHRAQEPYSKLLEVLHERQVFLLVKGGKSHGRLGGGNRSFRSWIRRRLLAKRW